MTAGQAKGQALIIVIFVIAGLLLLTTSLQESINMIVARLELQHIADGSALQAGSIMADSLNLIAITNGMLIGAGISVFFSKGATLKWVRSIQNLQDQVIQATPSAASLAAIMYGLEQNAKTVGVVIDAPEMCVQRHYLNILGLKRIPLWCKDSGDLQQRKTVVSWSLSDNRKWVTTAASIPTGGRLIGKYVLWPLPAADYKAYLAKSSSQ
ncbi:MAG: hypothetical protein GX058_00355 [Firmicutes bacterium]|nr:hypothetical protein [Bacillota bacterium]